jgi:hypothetical protein
LADDEMTRRLDETLQKHIAIQPSGGLSLKSNGAVMLMINCFLIGFDLVRLVPITGYTTTYVGAVQVSFSLCC